MEPGVTGEDGIEFLFSCRCGIVYLWKEGPETRLVRIVWCIVANALYINTYPRHGYSIFHPAPSSWLDFSPPLDYIPRFLFRLSPHSSPSLFLSLFSFHSKETDRHPLLCYDHHQEVARKKEYHKHFCQSFPAEHIHHHRGLSSRIQTDQKHGGIFSYDGRWVFQIKFKFKKWGVIKGVIWPVAMILKEKVVYLTESKKIYDRVCVMVVTVVFLVLGLLDAKMTLKENNQVSLCL